MPLQLSVLRCPSSAVPEQRTVPGGEYMLGRATECDWVLQDPTRVLSKRHCVVEFLAGGWQVRDLSANGTCINGAADPLGPGKVHHLRDGDRLQLGDWDIECRITAEADIGEGRWQSASAVPDPLAPPRPAADDIFAVPLPGLTPAGGPPMGAAPLLPADFDPFAPADPGPAMPDHRPSVADAFTPPRTASPDLLPEDWDRPLLPTATAAPLPDPFAAASLPAPAVTAPPPMAAPPMAAPPPPVAVPSPAPSGSLDQAVALLLEGMGMPHAPAGADPAAALRQAGAALRTAVDGLRALLIARADVKRGFRIEATILGQANNNPLKFAVSTEAALAELLRPGSRGGAAVQETVDDLTAHQVATLAATQAAARALLERLAPEPLEAAAPGGMLQLPGAREKRLWDSYRHLHQQVTDQFDDDFDSAFGKAFARAYEAATRRGA